MMRATDPGVQPISGPLPVTCRAWSARRQTLASGSLSMARVHDSSHCANGSHGKTFS